MKLKNILMLLIFCTSYPSLTWSNSTKIKGYTGTLGDEEVCLFAIDSVSNKKNVIADCNCTENCYSEWSSEGTKIIITIKNKKYCLTMDDKQTAGPGWGGYNVNAQECNIALHQNWIFNGQEIFTEIDGKKHFLWVDPRTGASSNVITWSRGNTRWTLESELDLNNPFLLELNGLSGKKQNDGNIVFTPKGSSFLKTHRIVRFPDGAIKLIEATEIQSVNDGGIWGQMQEDGTIMFYDSSSVESYFILDIDGSLAQYGSSDDASYSNCGVPWARTYESQRDAFEVFAGKIPMSYYKTTEMKEGYKTLLKTLGLPTDRSHNISLSDFNEISYFRTKNFLSSPSTNVKYVQKDIEYLLRLKTNYDDDEKKIRDAIQDARIKKNETIDFASLKEIQTVADAAGKSIEDIKTELEGLKRTLQEEDPLDHILSAASLAGVIPGLSNSAMMGVFALSAAATFSKAAQAKRTSNLDVRNDVASATGSALNLAEKLNTLLDAVEKEFNSTFHDIENDYGQLEALAHLEDLAKNGLGEEHLKDAQSEKLSKALWQTMLPALYEFDAYPPRPAEWKKSPNLRNTHDICAQPKKFDQMATSAADGTPIRVNFQRLTRSISNGNHTVCYATELPKQCCAAGARLISDGKGDIVEQNQFGEAVDWGVTQWGGGFLPLHRYFWTASRRIGLVNKKTRKPVANDTLKKILAVMDPWELLYALKDTKPSAESELIRTGHLKPGSGTSVARQQVATFWTGIKGVTYLFGVSESDKRRVKQIQEQIELAVSEGERNKIVNKIETWRANIAKAQTNLSKIKGLYDSAKSAKSKNSSIGAYDVKTVREVEKGLMDTSSFRDMVQVIMKGYMIEQNAIDAFQAIECKIDVSMRYYDSVGKFWRTDADKTIQDMQKLISNNVRLDNTRTDLEGLDSEFDSTMKSFYPSITTSMTFADIVLPRLSISSRKGSKDSRDEVIRILDVAKQEAKNYPSQLASILADFDHMHKIHKNDIKEIYDVWSKISYETKEYISAYRILHELNPENRR